MPNHVPYKLMSVEVPTKGLQKYLRSLPPGTRVPPRREMRPRFKVSVATWQVVIDNAEAEGYLERGNHNVLFRTDEEWPSDHDIGFKTVTVAERSLWILRCWAGDRPKATFIYRDFAEARAAYEQSIKRRRGLRVVLEQADLESPVRKIAEERQLYGGKK